MSDVPVSVVGLVGIALTAFGGVLGAWITARSKNRSTEVDAANRMIDQLQEELGGHRTAQETRFAAAEKRLTEVERRNGILLDRNDRYRDLLHKHRSHIWDGKPPPPPEWPDDLPR